MSSSNGNGRHRPPGPTRTAVHEAAHACLGWSYRRDLDEVNISREAPAMARIRGRECSPEELPDVLRENIRLCMAGDIGEELYYVESDDPAEFTPDDLDALRLQKSALEIDYLDLFHTEPERYNAEIVTDAGLIEMMVSRLEGLGEDVDLDWERERAWRDLTLLSDEVHKVARWLSEFRVLPAGSINYLLGDPVREI